MGAPTKRIYVSMDWPLMIPVLFLNLVGLLNLASASPGTSVWQRQFLSFIISMGIMIIIGGINYRLFERIAYPIYGSTLFLLFLTEFIGKRVAGTKGWLDLGVFHFQPSEIAKIGTILALAKYFHDQRKGGPYGVKELIRPLAIGGGSAILIALQPDIGTMLMLLFIVGGIILFVGVRRRLFYTALISVLIVACLFWFAPQSWGLVKEHQRDRILTFLNPERDPRGTGYNVIQSKVAVGSGRIAGKGYKLGTQTALRYLPERHTDFVFSVIGEEWGFIGSTLVLGVLLFIMLWGLSIASGSKDRFGAITAMGVVLMLFFHTAINVAMTLGAVPVVGIPLPFLSSGGSFLVSTMTGIGLLMSIEERRWMF